ncbi:MAG: ATP-binding protein [bacterium]|nr:ATP-binding protein [bacterium]
MRIAFVGKGGSGKTTLSALFSQFIKKNHSPVLVIDADINMHLGSLLGFENTVLSNIHISHPESVKYIKTYLRGNNERIKQLSHFRKTTPPTKDSNFIVIHDQTDTVLAQYTVGSPDFRLMIVGTYDTDDIGASCYHNNLAILENVLSHIVDNKGTVVTDMVAGVDAFANSLHAQFDMLVLTVEPTNRGVEVFNQYKRLADDAGVSDSLYVVGNKIRNSSDVDFIKRNIPNERLIGFFPESDYLRKKDQEGGSLDVELLEKENKKLLSQISDQLSNMSPDYHSRLQKLYNLHRRYVAQDFIRERFGDLADHIDESFDFQEFIKNHA